MQESQKSESNRPLKKIFSYFGGKARRSAKDTPQEIAFGSQSSLSTDGRCAVAGGWGKSNRGGGGVEDEEGGDKSHLVGEKCVAVRNDMNVSFVQCFCDDKVMFSAFLCRLSVISS